MPACQVRPGRVPSGPRTSMAASLSGGGWHGRPGRVVTWLVTSPGPGWSGSCSGPLQDRTVNIKWYLKREGLLDTTWPEALDYYLVLTGPPSPAGSSQGTARPWCIPAVFLFDARQLRSEQITRGVHCLQRRQQQWAAAEVYPAATNPQLVIAPQQAGQLRLFAA
jgi:hypothetical protein